MKYIPTFESYVFRNQNDLYYYDKGEGDYIKLYNMFYLITKVHKHTASNELLDFEAESVDKGITSKPEKVRIKFNKDIKDYEMEEIKK